MYFCSTSTTLGPLYFCSTTWLPLFLFYAILFGGMTGIHQCLCMFGKRSRKRYIILHVACLHFKFYGRILFYDQIFVLRKLQHITVHGNCIVDDLWVTRNNRDPDLTCQATIFWFSGLHAFCSTYAFCSTHYMACDAISGEYCSTETTLSNLYRSYLPLETDSISNYSLTAKLSTP